MVKAPSVQMFAFTGYRQALKFQKEMAERGCPSMMAEMADGLVAVMVKGHTVPIKKAKEKIP